MTNRTFDSFFSSGFRLLCVLTLSMGLMGTPALTHSAFAQEEGEEEAADGGLGTSAIGEDFAIPVDPVLVSVIQNRKILGSMTVLLVLNATEISTYDEVRPHVPRLHDRYLRIMTEFAARELVFNRPVDVARVTQLLQAETDGYLHRDDVEVLIYQAQLQRRLVKGR